MAKKNSTPKKDCWHDLFLEKLAETCNVRESCRHAGIDRQTAYNARKSNPAFKDLWTVAIDEGVDVLRLEARRRAVEGWDEPVFQGGEKIGAVRKYSHTLLIFLLKAHAPQEFRDNVHHTGAMDHNITHNGRLADMTPEQLHAEVQALADRNVDGG